MKTKNANHVHNDDSDIWASWRLKWESQNHAFDHHAQPFLHRLQKKCTWYFRLTSHISTTRTSFPSMLRNVYKCNFFSHWPSRRYKMRPGCLVIQKSNKSWIKTVSVWIHSLSISWQGPTQWQIFRKLYGVIDALFEKRFLSPSIWYSEIYKLP